MAAQGRQLEEVVSQDCVFCRIVSGAIPATPIYQSSDVVVIQDINPQAPTHLLIVTREHIPGVLQLDPESPVWNAVLSAVHRMTATAPVDGGFRLIINSGPDGGQTIGHLHVHMLGGRPLRWPPG